eukprot:TRINITY_DN58550_c0_g2_i1.p1 TRINITY_DN58550_c0_g2~~TRINITY_DN58550_c0_g2_i1.p1  ORF type:complete len:599 (-),score=258.43 TRINITY_DN58550_c0_g2_i1:75-1838(-)
MPVEYAMFWLFDMTNSHDVLYGAALPRFQKRGPFVYQRHLHKLNAAVKNAEVTFQPWTFYTPVTEPFELLSPETGVPELVTPMPPESEIAMFDLSLYSILHHMKENPLNDPGFNNTCAGCANCTTLPQCLEYNIAPTWSLNETLSGALQGLITRRSAADWLGVVRPDAVSNTLQRAVNRLMRRQPVSTDSAWAYLYNSSAPTPGDASQFYRSNTLTYLQTKEVGAGAAVHRPLAYVRWNELLQLNSVSETTPRSHWNTLSFAKRFAGWNQAVSIHDGFYIEGRETTYPGIKPSDSLQLWIDEVAHGFQYESGAAADNNDNGDVIIGADEQLEMRGVKCVRFRNSLNNFDPTSLFFSDTPGLLNMSQLYNYAPLFVSPSHFYGFDQLWQRMPEGTMRPPQRQMDDSFIDVELESGIIVNMAQRLQFNAWLPYVDFAGTSVEYNMNRTHWGSGYPQAHADLRLVPGVIIERRRQINEDVASDLLRLQHHSKTQRTLRVAGGAGGMALFVIGLCLLFVGCRRRQAEDLATLKAGGSRPGSARSHKSAATDKSPLLKHGDQDILYYDSTTTSSTAAATTSTTTGAGAAEEV